MNLINKLLLNMSLTVKMLCITVGIGIMIWGLLDFFQSRQLRNIFESQLNDTLHKQAQKNRLLFDDYVRSHSFTARIIVNQKSFNDYTGKLQWRKEQAEPRFHRSRPPWLPGASILRAFAAARIYILYDNSGMAREIYSTFPDETPKELLNSSDLMRQLSHNQNFMTAIGGTAFTLATESFNGAQSSAKGFLMVASPLDDEFLYQALSSIHPDNIVALADPADTVILASSRPEMVHAGTSLDNLKGRYVIAGKSFFDYGSSDLQVSFITLIHQDSYDNLSREILWTGRTHRALTGLFLVVSFSMLMLWITKHITEMTKKIESFSTVRLGAQPEKKFSGDQLQVLEKQFQHLTDEVIQAQDKLRFEAEQNIILTRKTMEADQRQRLLDLLQSVTRVLNAGVITRDESGFKAANDQMQMFINQCGELSDFIIHASKETDIILYDCVDSKRNFHISRPHITTGDDIILVQDITDRRKAEEEREKLIMELQEALAKVKTLSGFLPICASCKKIRDDKGYWNQIESYIRDHSDAQFSHGICPACARDLYPELDF